MPKKSIHPKWFSETQVYCDGKLVMVISSTKIKLNIDIWSGNHPFYTGSLKNLDSERRIERFFKKYNYKN
jgi:large subunit ribosomal protein L31